MMKLKFVKILFFILLTIDALSQEKRLALVIGNSNYSERLPNPVNDALLMKSTLESLDFDVILDTNVSKITDFEAVVREFGDRRADYDVGFIYYAGHGVQIENVNYLLATEEKYITKFDVEDNALSVQKIMRYLIARSNEVNVIILDACRNNPFEKNWDPKARSVEGGRGLAKMEPPTGSLIAFSTDAGNTAADGSISNSDYCLSLTKNMLIENLTLDQVFRNVRMDVLQMSDGRQRPIEQSQLTGQAFYLKKSSYTNEIIRIDSLIESENYVLALEKANMILAVDPENKSALLRKGRINYLLPKDEFYDGAELFRAKELYPKDPEVMIYLARFYTVVSDYNKSIDEIDRAIELDSLYADAFYWKAKIYGEFLDRDDLAMESVNRAIDISPLNEAYYLFRGGLHANYLDIPDQAYRKREIASKAILEYQRVLTLSPNNVEAMHSLGNIYLILDNIDSALYYFDAGAALEDIHPKDAALCYLSMAKLSEDVGLNDVALDYFNFAIDVNPNSASAYAYRANFYCYTLKDYNNALIDYTRAIDLEPWNADALHDRALLYNEELGQYQKAIDDLNNALIIRPKFVSAVNSIGMVYKSINELDSAIMYFERGISFELSFPQEAAFAYQARAEVLIVKKDYSAAFNDYCKAIQLDSLDSYKFYGRAYLNHHYMANPSAALLDYTRAIELDPGNVSYYLDRGILFGEKLSLPNRAISDFLAILEIEPENMWALNNLGASYGEIGNMPMRIEMYQKVIALSYKDPEVGSLSCINLAEIYVARGDLDSALTYYSKAIELEPNNASRYTNRARFYMKSLSDLNSAYVDFSKAIELEPDNASLYYDRGYFFLWYLKSYDNAIKDFERILDLQGNNVAAINILGLVYREMGSYDLAIEMFTRGITMNLECADDVAYCYRNRAFISAERGDLAEAEADYNMAIELDPENPDRHLDRANFFTDYEMRNEDALHDFTKAIEVAPLEAKYYFSRGNFYADILESPDKAMEDYKKILEIDSDDIDAINAIGLVAKQQGRSSLALEYFEKGISLEKTNPSSSAYCYVNRADLFIEDKRFDEALADLDKAIELDVDNPELYLYRGDFYKMRDKPHDALIDYTIGLMKDSVNSELLFNRSRLFSEAFGEHKTAIRDCKEIITRDTNDVTILNWLGVYSHRQLNDSLASVYYDRVIQKDGFKFQDSVHAYSYGIAWAYNNRALLYQKQNELAIPTSYYNRTIEIDRSPIRFYSRGWFLALYLHEFDKAIEDLTVAIELDEKNPDWYLSRAKLHYLQGNQKLAKKDFDVAVKLSGEDSYYLAARGNYFSKIGEYSKAASDFENALKVKPDDSMTFHFITENYIRLGKFDEAIENAMYSTKHFEDDTTSFEQLGRIYFLQNKFLKSLGAYQKAVDLMEFEKRYETIDPKMETLFLSDLHLRMAEIYKVLGDADLQCESLRKADACLKDETRPGKVEIESEISTKMKAICN